MTRKTFFFDETKKKKKNRLLSLLYAMSGRTKETAALQAD